MTEYDRLFQFLSGKIKEVLHEELGEYLYLIGISHSFPKDAEVNLLVLMITTYLLKIHGIKTDSEFPDLVACEEEFNQFFSSAESLSQKIRETGMLIKLSKNSDNVA